MPRALPERGTETKGDIKHRPTGAVGRIVVGGNAFGVCEARLGTNGSSGHTAQSVDGELRIPATEGETSPVSFAANGVMSVGLASTAASALFETSDIGSTAAVCASLASSSTAAPVRSAERIP